MSPGATQHTNDFSGKVVTGGFGWGSFAGRGAVGGARRGVSAVRLSLAGNGDKHGPD